MVDCKFFIGHLSLKERISTSSTPKMGDFTLSPGHQDLVCQCITSLQRRTLSKCPGVWPSWQSLSRRDTWWLLVWLWLSVSKICQIQILLPVEASFHQNFQLLFSLVWGSPINIQKSWKRKMGGGTSKLSLFCFSTMIILINRNRCPHFLHSSKSQETGGGKTSRLANSESRPDFLPDGSFVL